MRCHSIGALALCLLLAACGGGGDSTGSSGGGGGGGGSGGSGGGPTTLSHNPGTDCINCHRSGGSAASNGIFTVAGTVYRSNGTAQASATVQLYPQGSSTAQATLTTDALGNFYTTQPVASLVPAPGQQFAQGANAVVRITGGASRSMPGTITNGSCNGCHSPGGGVARVTAQQVDSGPAVAAAAAGDAPSPTDSSRQILAQVATGAAHGCVVTSGGAVLCWGSNRFGQLGSRIADQAVPMPVEALGHVSAATSAMAIAAGDHHTCVLSAGGLVLCWGANDQGQLGNGSTQPAVVSVVPLSGVTALSAAGDRSCARVGDGDTASFHCWGLTPEAVDIGAGTIPDALLPLLDAAAPAIGEVDLRGVTGLEAASFAHIASHAGHGCGITKDSRLMCWEEARASVAIPVP